jgi:serine/threonine-protein kinase
MARPPDNVMGAQPPAGAALGAPRAAAPQAQPQAAGGAARAGAVPFEVLAEIASGATARVDLCRVLSPHPRAGQLVAVKRLHPHIAEDPTFANQFFDEAWMTASLKHPNVVEVAGWGMDAEGTYLAVELVQGVSLLRLMKTIFETGEVFTERMVVYIGSRICHGLAAAHGLRAPNGEVLNLVHRDLTPGNLLVGFNGDLKIADFGMAKAKQRLTKTLTGMRKGEPTYMAPEQASSDVIDARADLFSLGVLLFELFAGRRPWIAKSDVEMVQITAREPPADLRELRPKIDRELVNVVNRCLEKDPARRFATAWEIAERFEEWLLVHGYQEGNEEALARFVRRNAMRQMRWFERAISGELAQAPVGREPPRVPTYTENTDRPPPGKTTPPPAPRPPAPSSTSTPRARNTAPDPRSVRAANAVQELKKLAAIVEPPRARRRMPTLDDDDGDVTDVELRVAAAQQGGGPRIVDGANEEEVPTLVQKGDAEIARIRAQAKQQAAAAGAARPQAPARPAAPMEAKPPYVVPSLIVDEESDQRITEVKREQQRAAGGPPPRLQVADPDSELPTEPVKKEDKRGGSQPAPRPPAPAHPGVARPAIPKAPAVPHLPPAMPAPKQPFTAGAAATPPQRAPSEPALAPQDAKIQPLPRPQDKPSTVRPPPPERRPTPYYEGAAAGAEPRAPSRPAYEPPPAVEVPPQSVVSMDPSRVSQGDDVEVLDRSKIAPLLTEDALIAEADRLAIEAVRRNEEARAAQLRAERKAAAAKAAGDAARIAAEAVRMVRSAGLSAAAQRLDEARAIEQALQSGKIPGGDVTSTGAQRALSAEVTRTPPAYMQTGPFPTGIPPAPAQAPAQTSPFPVPPSAHSPSQFPPAPQASPAALAAMSRTGEPPSVYPPPGPPVGHPSVPPGAYPSQAPPRQSYFPPEPVTGGAPYAMGSGTYAMGNPSLPPQSESGPGPSPYGSPYGLAPPSPGLDDDALQAQLKPSILGLPSRVVVALAVVGVFAVLGLALLLAR